ncbi:Heavy metal-associated isoprenylated plant protein 20 [Zea mays]|uniref:Farnesylated protein 2 n=2 Tax=Zea mays TaxID=4577 RepID=B6T0P0_MAIZE|nr:heavy metal-associated isoprenylated plant protein 26-like [Zea mays]ACG30673.1 farnesylated protein 2 [Zea mays]AQK58017.1 Farnesylated protein 2 [Zea mays]PWZ25133.1 Heavy metal-associated isoprenylated plant protein 20 [Zea mays]|eukprot:NP_001288682.1 heavy metal-associated isoprenylated plant protein 26-like [Zea mays]
MGILDHLSHLCSITETKEALKLRKKRPLQTVNIKVKMDCEGCERRVKSAVKSMRGVTSVAVNAKQSKCTVTGNVEPAKVLERVKATGKNAEMWPYVPYALTTYPYVGGAYDKKAPAGFVRSAPQAMADPGAPELKYMNMFNDDNVDACTVM